MIQVIDQLGRDHRNMRLLLDIVEAEMEGYRAGQPPDFELLQMIARYILDYPELIHHPREDLVFERLLERDPAAGEAIGDLIADHRRLAQLTQRFAAAVANASRDVELPRAWLEALLREFLQANREHMQAEEKHFLPRAMARLTDADWDAIDQRISGIADPAFGEQRAGPYLRLHERILKLHL
jgi:hemerythrin-like domain-containing protein